MICYLDMTFCVSPNCKNECGRKLTDEIRTAAYRWWGGTGAPIAVGHFCGEPEAGEPEPPTWKGMEEADA